MYENAKLGLKALKESVAEAEPDLLDGRSAMKMMQIYAEHERVAAAGKALMARRVAESGAWRKSGEKSAAHFVAAKTGTSVGQAVNVIETANRLADLPQTEKALREGKLSETQAKEIASAAAADPKSEKKLLDVAAKESLVELKEQCVRVRAAALPDEKERYARIHARRRLRTWTDAEGAFRLDALLTPDAGAKVVAALEPLRERIFREARKQGRKEPYDAYGADALVELAASSRAGGKVAAATGPGAMVHVFVDYQALKRGHTVNGEVCEIGGVGAIPVATAEALATDCYLRVLVKDGIDIKTVSHPGKTINVRLRTALLARGYKCAVPGCGTRHHLQIDHTKERRDDGLTKLDNLDWLCPYHHYLKTHKGYVLAGKPGARTWLAPGDPPPEPGPSP
jgi:hypothetical protein